MESLKQALAGEGGRNMVKLEYAKALQGVTISGQPFATRSTVSRFEHAAVSPGAAREVKDLGDQSTSDPADSTTGKDRR